MMAHLVRSMNSRNQKTIESRQQDQRYQHKHGRRENEENLFVPFVAPQFRAGCFDEVVLVNRISQILSLKFRKKLGFNLMSHHLT